MSRGLGRIERTIVALIEDKDATKSIYTTETLAVAIYQPVLKERTTPTLEDRIPSLRTNEEDDNTSDAAR
jgi:hypothetical protein